MGALDPYQGTPGTGKDGGWGGRAAHRPQPLCWAWTSPWTTGQSGQSLDHSGQSQGLPRPVMGASRPSRLTFPALSTAWTLSPSVPTTGFVCAISTRTGTKSVQLMKTNLYKGTECQIEPGQIRSGEPHLGEGPVTADTAESPHNRGGNINPLRET